MEAMTRWLVILGLSAGCSFSLSGPDPNRPRGKAPDCSTSKTSVVLDGLMAAVSGVLAISLAADSNSGAAAVAPLAVGSLFAGAAIHGNSVVNDCRQANMEYYGEQAGPPPPVASDDQPRKLRPPSGPVKPAAAPQPEPEAEDETEQQPAPQPAQPPQPAKQAVAQPPKQAPQPQPPNDSWSNFWKEVR